MNELETEFNVKYIHLVRKNIARSVISAEIAKKTQEWHMKDPTSWLPTDSKKVDVQPNLLRKQIAITEKNWEQARVFFSGRDVVELSYEDLVDEPESCMSKIFSWLGLEIVPVSSWTNKQNPESLSDLVENYSDILPILEEKGFE